MKTPASFSKLSDLVIRPFVLLGKMLAKITFAIFGRVSWNPPQWFSGGRAAWTRFNDARPTTTALGLITVFLLRLALRARRSKVRMGGDAMIGQIAVVTQPLAPSGQVMVNGELWQAESAKPAALGEQVRVRGLRDLTLLVERVP